MNKEQIVKTGIASTASISKWKDYQILIKFRLTMLVVMSALLAFMIVARGNFSLVAFIILGVGGFCITAAANALNQALEKDYDKLMARTANRPVATGRMTVSEAVMIGGILFVIGTLLLAFFNPLASVLGATAVVSYAFIYTPLKRISPMSVFVGAIPGALPTMIAVVAVDGYISSMAIILFGLQFFWQFAHFWSIGFLGYEDYKRAGFKLVPEQGGKIHPNLGLQSMLFSLLLIPCSIAPYLIGVTLLWPAIIAVGLSLVYAGFGWNMQVKKDQVSARQLMFASFLYLPVVLIIFYLGTV